jgi:hypothetical protein
MSDKPRSFRGQISYRLAGAAPTGHEWFSTTVFPDGSRTVRCECHFWRDDLVRDVTFTVDRTWRPVDAYLRVARANAFLGAARYGFSGRRVVVDGIDAEGKPSHLQQDLELDVPACGFHPIYNDALWTALFDLRRPNDVQRFPGCVTYSKEMIGKEKLGIERFDLAIRLLGQESVSVSAGVFDSRHFEVLIEGLDAPFHIWTTGPDHILVREQWAQMPGESFELAALEFD